MSRAASTVETCWSSFPERDAQAPANFLKASVSSPTSRSLSGVASTLVKASISASLRQVTGSLAATPRGSIATMS